MLRIARAVGYNGVRFMSDLPGVTGSVTSSSGSGGSTFIQRFTAFTIGAGVVSPLMYYFIYEELKGTIKLL